MDMPLNYAVHVFLQSSLLLAGIQTLSRNIFLTLVLQQMRVFDS